MESYTISFSIVSIGNIFENINMMQWPSDNIELNKITLLWFLLWTTTFLMSVVHHVHHHKLCNNTAAGDIVEGSVTWDNKNKILC